MIKQKSSFDQLPAEIQPAFQELGVELHDMLSQFPYSVCSSLYMLHLSHNVLAFTNPRGLRRQPPGQTDLASAGVVCCLTSSP